MLRKVAVVGAGNMGSGIAQKIASAKVPVLLVDSSQERAAQGKERIAKVLAEGVQRKLFSPADVEAILARVTPTADLQALADVDLVIEAVFEDLTVKRELFTKLGKICGKQTVLATNTSSFLVRDLAQVTTHPERVIGLHYFYHPAKNRLVEIIGHSSSDPHILKAAWAQQEGLGKTPIASTDAPGFVVNRFFVPWLNEAVRLHEEGIAIPSIEAAAKEAFGVGMGPFELMNVTGVPITQHSATSLAGALGPFYAPAKALVAQVASGKPWSLDGAPDAKHAQLVRERLWGVVLHVASALVSEGVGTLEDTDLGARVGLRWPVGPFEKANQLGDAASAWVRAVEERYNLPPQMAWQKRPFVLSRVQVSVESGVATLRINRPDQMNALDPETVNELAARFAEVSARDDVAGIVLAGAGKAFVAGADVKFFVDNIEAKRVDAIARFAEAGQKLFRAIEKSKKRVVCAMDGLALGGGAELALACHVIVATPRARMGFPETGLGIYPGLGGTQRLTRRLGKGLARLYLYTGNTMGSEELTTLGLAWKVVQPETLTDAVKEALTAAPVQPKVDSRRLSADTAHVAKFLDAAQAESLLDGSLTLPGSPLIADVAKKVRRKAPLAVAEVARLTELAETTDLDVGLAAELAGLVGTFSSADALEGMRAVLERRFAKFTGA